MGKINKKQEQALWKLFVVVSQGHTLYEEDHDYDEERQSLIEAVNFILNDESFRGK